MEPKSTEVFKKAYDEYMLTHIDEDAAMRYAYMIERMSK